ncbi:MAG: hypothetical protein IJ718_06415 [Paludibacteraceae bacterium]|nr:hypothetical protein [Paludibacteraceae bacterium]
MRKIIFTLMLVVASGLWMTSTAICMAPIPDAMYQPFATVTGILRHMPMPCEEGEDCPPCLTFALVTEEQTYYLTTDNKEMEKQLDSLMNYLMSVNCICPQTISGTPFTRGGNDYIKVLKIESENAQLSSLCDEWNIAKISNAGGPIETILTVKSFLGSDTIIESQNYVKLIEDSKYKGAMREGESGVIYYIPAGSAHEYLLYNFNAQVGDRLTNLWYGGDPERCPNGYNAIVLSISDETPRVFTIEVEYIISDSDGDYIIPWLIYWTEGVGLSDGPAGQFCPGPDCACSCGQLVLCAYKNGEQIYVSEMGEQYGCVYNYDPYAAPSDTIPLFSYTGDDPGSSTVDPVDPNQVVAMLKGDELTIKESSGETITYQLSNTSASSAPGLRKMPQSQTFQGEISVTLTEEGNYSLILTNPGWNYRIVGRFEYPKKHQGIDPVAGDEEKSGIKKVLRNGQIVIERNGKRYNLLGGEL